jgi:hypothetical protein
LICTGGPAVVYVRTDYFIERFFWVRFEAFFGAERDSDCSGLRGAWSPMMELTGQTL